jgi:hypothetical protein
MTEPDTHSSIASEPKRENVWRRIYHGNKGAILILLAEVAGSSMDAIVRFLQQGRTQGHSMHPFQVCVFFLICFIRGWT